MRYLKRDRKTGLWHTATVYHNIWCLSTDSTAAVRKRSLATDRPPGSVVPPVIPLRENVARRRLLEDAAARLKDIQMPDLPGHFTVGTILRRGIYSTFSEIRVSDLLLPCTSILKPSESSTVFGIMP